MGDAATRFTLSGSAASFGGRVSRRISKCSRRSHPKWLGYSGKYIPLPSECACVWVAVVWLIFFFTRPKWLIFGASQELPGPDSFGLFQDPLLPRGAPDGLRLPLVAPTCGEEVDFLRGWVSRWSEMCRQLFALISLVLSHSIYLRR